MLAAFALGLASIAAALVSGGTGNAGFVFPLLMFGALALSAGVGDRRMLRAGGLQGPRDSRGTCGACVSRCSSQPRRFLWDQSDEFLSRSAFLRCG